MHSFHRSRGRILFEVLCALAVSASCVGAWMQTGASAMLPAAAAAALYGLVHMFDMRRPKAVGAAGVDEVAVTGEQGDLLAYAASLPEPAVAEEPEAVQPTGDPEPMEPESSEEAEAAEVAASEEPEPAEPEASEQAEPSEAEPVAELEPAEQAPPETADRPPIEPLFEPEPLVRTKRAVFGRKAG